MLQHPVEEKTCVDSNGKAGLLVEEVQNAVGLQLLKQRTKKSKHALKTQ